MKKLIIIILLWNNAFSQSYVATWTGSARSFDIQRSSDGKNFKTISTTKDSTFTGAGATYYWRIKLNDVSGFRYSDTVWVYAMTTVTNARLSFSGTNAIIKWTGNTETNLAYYTIESISRVTVVMKHGGNYLVAVPKTGVTYEIVAHYKNGDIYVLKVFNP